MEELIKQSIIEREFDLSVPCFACNNLQSANNNEEKDE